MPKRGIAALLLTTAALILLLSFKTPDQTLPVRGGGVAIVEPTATAATGRPTPTPRTGGPTPATGATTPAPTATGTTGASAAKTVDGPVVDTQYGPVQVEVVMGSGKIKDIVALQLPSGRRSGQISNYSAPILRQEALQAQSASIDTVSGATYTSDAYTQSLQAALDQARHA
ncbi:MAG: hypothetical protein QOE66_2490 [Chloroflexota bacterium]|jgi:uncharacterized protein with FMN-binding domain|nr:hypothetical protein [Chloroflexota bacterium]